MRTKTERQTQQVVQRITEAKSVSGVMGSRIPFRGFNDRLADAIADGWQPFGSISSSGTWLSILVVRYGDSK